MKQEMDAMKIVSEKEMKVMQEAIKNIEGDVRNNSANNAGSWPVGNGFNKSAMEHTALANLKSLGDERQGYIQWHERIVNAMAHVHR